MVYPIDVSFILVQFSNGLSSFEALNETELDRANGEIKRLVSINQTVVAISNVRETSNYIQVVTFQQANQGDGIIAVANQYFGTQYPHTKTLGTNLPASVFINDGVVFGFHSARTDVFMYQGDGEQSISDVKMKNYFQQLGNDGVSDAVSVYDRFHEEYLLTCWRNYLKEAMFLASTGNLMEVEFPISDSQPILNTIAKVEYYLNNKWNSIEGTMTSIDPSSGTTNLVVITFDTTSPVPSNVNVKITYSIPETISWFNGNEITQQKRWKTFYDFTPEQYCQIGSDVIAFDGGKVNLLNVNSVRNNFFGKQYTSQLNIVSNENPDETKGWYSIYLESKEANGFNWSIPVIKNSIPQLSRLVKAGFKKLEEYYWSEFKRDLNTAGATNPIVNGRQLRSSSIELDMVNDSTEEFTLRSVITEFEDSPRGT